MSAAKQSKPRALKRTHMYGGYQLTLCWRGEWLSRTHKRVYYSLRRGAEKPIFRGDGFGYVGETPVGNDSACGVLAFLCARPGDTDPAYFARYTKRQIRFAESESSRLSSRQKGTNAAN